MSRLSEATGRPSSTTTSTRSMRRPDEWKEQMAQVDETVAQGHPRLSDVHARTASPTSSRCATRRSSAACRPGTRSCSRRTRRSCAPTPIPKIRKKLHDEAVEFKSRRQRRRHLPHLVGLHVGPAARCCRRTSACEGKTIGEIAKAQGKGIIDAFLDLVGRGESRHRVPARREQRRRRGGREDPELSERDHRPVGRRRARAVPERLRLQHPAAGRMGAREADHVAGERRCGG